MPPKSKEKREQRQEKKKAEHVEKRYRFGKGGNKK